MRHFITFLFVGLFVSGCYDMHGRIPSLPLPDSGPVIGGDAGPIMPTPDAGMPVEDGGVITADAGSDAGPVEEPDAGSFTCPSGLANYTLNIGASPLSSSVTAGTANVPSVSVVLSTPPDTGITYTTFRILGRGDTDGTFRTEHFRDVVTFCTLFEDDVPLGAGAPDERGLIVIGGFSHHLDVGHSANLRIECDADPDVAQPTGDRYVVSLNSLIAGVEPVTVTDDLGCERLPVWGSSLLRQLESDDPWVTVTVMPPAITLSVTHNLFPPSIGQPFAVPRRNFGFDEMCAHGGDVTIHSMGVHLYGDAATYGEVVLDNGRTGILGRMIPPAGMDQHLTVALTRSFVIADGTCDYIIRMASLAAVESRPSEATEPGHAYSGLPAGVDLDFGSVPGEWTHFAGRWHIHATDATGSPVYAVASAAPFYPDVVRLGRPFVYTNYGDVSATTVNDVRTVLFRPLFSANGLGGWTLRQFAVLMTDNDVAWAPGACLRSFRFQLGTVELPMGDYRIVDDAGNDLRSDTACYRPAGPANHVWIEFTSELRVTPGAVDYHTLTAIPNGFAAGDAIRTGFTAFNSTVPVTGCLEDAPDFGTWLRPIHSFGGVSDPWRPAFLWSDLSQAVHSSTPGSSSCDWTDEVYAMHESAIPPRTVTIAR